MPHPYQCLLYCSRIVQSNCHVLVAACGPYIHTFNAVSGDFLSTWPRLENSAGPIEKSQCVPLKRSASNLERDSSSKQQKRQELSPAREDSDSSAAEILAKDWQNGGKPPPKPPIIKLAATSNGQYVVAATGEDKCIRVFEVLESGALKQISERLMPKRPCATALTPDDSTILCADKFGDVYSLPIKGQTYETPSVNGDTKDKIISNVKDPLKPFTPSANSLTVHTKRNRDALRQQQNMVAKESEKKALNFEHQLLLGHVSLLTDVACVVLRTPSPKRRNYILTSDRDEHIRVSRGIPQAHVVEGYCLGHTKFVAKLCVPPSSPHLLLSGGGDDYLLLWDWLSGHALQKVDLRGHVENFRKQKRDTSSLSETHAKTEGTKQSRKSTSDKRLRIKTHDEDGADNICVSNIQKLELLQGSSGEHQTNFIVTCEGIPAIFMFSLSETASIEYKQTYALTSNIVDMTVMQERNSLFYSMDTVHKAFSTTEEVGDKEQNSRPSIGAITFSTGTGLWHEDLSIQDVLLPAMDRCAKEQPNVSNKSSAKGRSLRELLYGLESLRKQGGEEEILGEETK